MNHLGWLDPLFVATFCKRHPYYIAKKELWNNAFLRWYLPKIKAFPVDRKAFDFKAFKQGLNHLKDGNCVGIFAQGTRVIEDEFSSAKSGVVLFAQKSGAPVVPCLIVGNYTPFSKMKLIYGEPISYKQYEHQKLKSEELGELTKELMTKLFELSKKIKRS